MWSPQGRHKACPYVDDADIPILKQAKAEYAKLK